MATKPPEWQKYKVGKPSTQKGHIEKSCTPIEKVFHVSHVSDAFRMFEDEKIRSTLVWDKSRLKNTRTTVAWLSPNFWGPGFRYGNIKFDFDWKALVDGKTFYWVEDIPDYSPPAFRILITRNSGLDLDVYPVESGEGPLYHDLSNDDWYANLRFTAEFMVDRDLPLSECKSVGFVNHHPQYCNRDGSNCRDLNQIGRDGGIKLLGRLIGQGVLSRNPSSRRLLLQGGSLNQDAHYAWKHILYSFSKIETTGGLASTDAPARPVVLAMLDGLGQDSWPNVRDLGSLFRSKKELEIAARQQVAAAFDIPLENVPDSGDE